MTGRELRHDLRSELDELRATGLYGVSTSSARRESPRVKLADGRMLVNLCANNYLGLADDPELVACG